VHAPRDGPRAGLTSAGPRARWAVQQRPASQALCSCPGLPLLTNPKNKRGLGGNQVSLASYSTSPEVRECADGCKTE